jgi:outer membrane protein TolC
MRPFLMVWLALASCSASLVGQTNVLATYPLSLEECERLALQHNFDLQIERLTPEIARFNLAGAYGAYDPSLGLSAGHSYLDEPSGFDPRKAGVDYPYQLSTDNVEPGLSGQLPTGMSYDLGATFQNERAITDFSANPKDAALFGESGVRDTNQYNGFAGLTLRQPLLRNLWIDSNRERILVNKKTLKISELALRQQLMTVLSKVQIAYDELVFAFENVKVEESALALAQRLLAQTRRRVELGDIPELEATQAESQVQSAQASVIAAQQAATAAADALKNLFTDDFRSWADRPVQPTDALTPVVVPLDRSQSWQTALTARPDYLQAKLDLERRDIVLRYDFNQLFPSLDLVGSYGTRASGESLGAVTGDLRNVEHSAYSYGIVFSMPIGNQSARNRYKATRAERQQAILQFKKLEQDILVQIDIAVKAAESNFRRLSATRAARVFAEAALEAEQKKFLNGLSTDFIVLELQQRLTTARFTELRALADYHIALAQLALAEGTTLEKSRFSLEVK